MAQKTVEIPTNGRPGRIRNMAELAKLAGVSAGTVSRALANSDLINKKTRERIQALAQKHGYRPNQMARKLRTQRTGVIGVVIPLGHERHQHISDPFFMTLLGHLADELTESGHDLMLSRAIPEDDGEWLERIVESGMLDGVVMIGQSDQFGTIERVAEYYRPMVVWGSHRAGQTHCSVGTDSREGGRLAAAHVIERGARSLAFFGDTRGIEIAQRLDGVRDAITAAGENVLLHHLPVHLSIDEMSDQIAHYLAETDDNIDAIVAASDTIAMASIRHLNERGLRVPEDVAVIGFDDLPLATQTVPQLTTIHQDIAGGAKALIDKLKTRIAGEDTPSLIMPPELVVRASA